MNLIGDREALLNACLGIEDHSPPGGSADL